MSGSVRTRLVKIGNSQGIRIPKSLLEQSGIHADVEIEVEGDRLIVRAAKQARAGWDDALAKMAEQGDDALLDPEIQTEWDKTEWQW
jgi:antitoxin MazE